MAQSHNTDYNRTIELTTDKPTAMIGRSSRNAAKGLNPAKDNCFFESPVMSRNHAEVTMHLEPTHKVCLSPFWSCLRYLIVVTCYDVALMWAVTLKLRVDNDCHRSSSETQTPCTELS